ncbi:MAG: L-rhamnose mutarotase [Acidobacteria bacterium]|nr:L-rhamnose mutarotase [Acidobacteriota bacterium]
MKRYCLALDLKDDPKLIAEYEAHHQHFPLEITKSIRDSGVTDMQIFRIGNRMFMMIEANDDFSFAGKAEMDAANPKVQTWEALMWQYQQALPWAQPGEKWMLMERIFKL